ncbi:MAG: nucleotidyltransferase domain-containing protein [bacterium]
MMIPDLDLGRRFVAERGPAGRVLLCAVTGAHLYGFPSPDSDLDLKGIHLAPTPTLLGLQVPSESHDRLEIFEGVECDLTTHEARMALSLLLRGNGNVLERLLSPLQLVGGPDVEALQALGRGAISQRFAAHYRGFFQGMRREHDRQGTAKTMLYSLRVALTGTHLLRTGELEASLAVLGPEYGLPEVAELIAAKGAGQEKGPLDAGLDAHFRGRWAGLEQGLALALARSPLSPEPQNAAACHDWLVGARLAELHA